MRIGIITGVQAEADAFLADAASERLTLHSFNVRTLRHVGHEISITCCGIGKVHAAMAATALATQGIDLLMIIGTAGKLSGLAGDCFNIVDAFQGDYGASRDDGFAHYNAGAWPIGPTTLSPFSAMLLPDIGLPNARIVSGDCFVESATHAARLRDTFAADLVDMETAALAQAAAQLGIPWAGIKATTDDANGESGGDFQANLARAARAAADAAEQVIAIL
jgi:adenosylhomocysteine nucleosidase